MYKIQPLKSNWKLQDGYADHFKERTNSESWYNHCKGYSNVESVDKLNKLAPRVERIK